MQFSWGMNAGNEWVGWVAQLPGWHQARARMEPMVGTDASVGQRALSLLGLLVMVAVAWALSSHRRKFPWRVVLWGLGLQLSFGVLVLKTQAGMATFAFLNRLVTKLLSFTSEGSKFVFGKYATEEFTFALGVLPTIIFFSSLMAVLYHFGVMQKLVGGIAWVMQKTMRTSGPETLATAANIFVGQTEAPLVVEPFVQRMTRSELMTVMVGGFATVAGAVLAAYVGLLGPHYPNIAGHLIAASVMSAPAALLIAKVMVPETQVPSSLKDATEGADNTRASNLIDAAAAGASSGLKLALNVGAMLLAFIALVALVNALLAWPSTWAAEHWGWGSVSHPLTMERILGWVFWPLAFVMGVPLGDCAAVASLMGQKMVLNEFVAYVELSKMAAAGTLQHPRSMLIATYALCGFANFGSIAIQMGGIGAMAPNRRADLAKLGVRAMIGGTLAACMTACVAGILA